MISSRNQRCKQEFLDDIESDRKASNGDSTDDDSEDENVAEMDDEALYSSSS